MNVFEKAMVLLITFACVVLLGEIFYACQATHDEKMACINGHVSYKDCPAGGNNV